MGGSGLGWLDPVSPRECAAKTDNLRRAGCSQLGQSAPVALIAWSFWNW
jgi:hypothetical protein